MESTWRDYEFASVIGEISLVAGPLDRDQLYFYY